MCVWREGEGLECVCVCEEGGEGLECVCVCVCVKREGLECVCVCV